MSLTLTEPFVIDTNLVGDDVVYNISSDAILVMNPTGRIQPCICSAVGKTIEMTPNGRSTWYEGEISVRVLNKPYITSQMDAIGEVVSGAWEEFTTDEFWTTPEGGPGYDWDLLRWVLGDSYQNIQGGARPVDFNAVNGGGTISPFFHPSKIKIEFGSVGAEYYISSLGLTSSTGGLDSVYGGRWKSGDEIDISNIGAGYLYDGFNVSFAMVDESQTSTELFITKMEFFSLGYSSNVVIHSGIRVWDDVTSYANWYSYPNSWNGSAYLSAGNGGVYVLANWNDTWKNEAALNIPKYDKIRFTYSVTSIAGSPYLSYNSGFSSYDVSYVPLVVGNNQVRTYDYLDPIQVRFDLYGNNSITLHKVELGYPV